MKELLDHSSNYIWVFYDMIVDGDILYFSERRNGLFRFKLAGVLDPSEIESEKQKADTVQCYNYVNNKSNYYELNIKDFEIGSDGIFTTGAGVLKLIDREFEGHESNENIIAKRTALNPQSNETLVATDDGIFVMDPGKDFSKRTFNSISDFRKVEFLNYATNGFFIANNAYRETVLCTTSECKEFPILKDHAIASLKIYGKEIFISTDRGLYKIDLTNKDSKDRILDYSSLKLERSVFDFAFQEGNLYLATRDGILVLDKSIDDSHLDSLPLFVHINDQPLDEKLFFDYDDRDIKLDFTTISFPAENNIKYKYQLRGVDDKEKITAQRSLNYLNLAPGTYDFSILAQDLAGRKSILETATFTIARPWWMSYWFRGLLLIAGLSGLYLFYRYITQRELRKFSIQEKYADLELNALQSQMNPHFVFNALSSIQNLVIKKEDALANKYISKFAKLMRMYLDASHHKFITIESEMKIVEGYLALEKLRFENDIFVNIDNKLSSETYKSLIPATLIHPFVENALIHGLFHKKADGNLNIRLTEDDRNIMIEVEDDGVGLHRAAELNNKKLSSHESRATKILQDKLDIIRKVDRYNITFDISDRKINEGKSGTIVKIKIKR